MSKQFEQMTVAELREYAEIVQAQYDADEISGPSGRQIVRDAWARVEEAEQAEQLATLPQSTINVAVSSIASAVEMGHISAARQTAEHISAQISAQGGFTWTNLHWFICDITSAVDAPRRYGDRSFAYAKWPAAQIGDIVEFDEKQFRVVANYVSPGKTGQWVNQFSFYAIMPV